jgi:putative SOS response-associated peptidase YedK
MCGRFVLLTDLSRITESFSIQDIACEYRPSNNIHPGQQVAAVVRDNVNRLVEFKWGLIPSWAKDPAIGNKLINARAESIADKPSFRNAFKKRRCLIITDGFYEWQKISGTVRKPWFIHLKSGQPFGFAGLHEKWVSPEGQPVHSCTIITTTPNDLIEPIHSRMPVIVPKYLESVWLDPGHKEQTEFLSILKPYPSEGMECLDQYPMPFYRQPKE